MPPEKSPISKKQIKLPASLTIRQLAELLGVSEIELIKQLMRKGIMASVNQTIDFDIAKLLATDLGYEAIKKKAEPVTLVRKGVEGQNLQPRSPVVTVMGHIDHGKTSLLDAIRQTNVAATEAGGITQHIGAYQVEVDEQKITFLDTPGHEAFTAMRARGAQATDIAVLVVAADDGVMPQTIEAIAHANAAKVPIVVAINKIDKPTANVEMVKRQLAEQGLLIEEWGGEVVCVLVSAKKREGISELLENILVVAEVLELKANPNQLATGVVVEAKLDRTKGPLATVLVQNGTLEVGNFVVVGETWGRIKAMFNDKGKRVRKVEPSTPVEILGLNSAPQAGNPLTVVTSEKEARTLVQKWQEESPRIKPMRALRLEELSTQVEAGRVKELPIILKTDVQGSIEPIRDSLEQIKVEGVEVKVIHSGSGSISEGDVLLALASKGIVVGFNIRPDFAAQRLAELEGVDIRYYEVIYDLIDDIEKAIKGLREPTYVEVIEGHAEVRAIFPSGKLEKVAGVYVTEGKISRGTSVRLLRQGQTVCESTVCSLRRFKEDVKEVATGFECGAGIEGFTDFQVGDILELYKKEKAQ